MNIIIATSIQADSGYEEKLLAKLLSTELKKLNHKVDSCFIPYHRDMIALPEQVVAYQMMKGLDCDMLITIGYPAIYLNHHNKVSYLFQLAPMIYEYYNSNYGVLDNTQYSNIKKSMHYADSVVFKEAKKIYVNSNALQSQIKEYYEIDSEVFYLPNLLNDSDSISVIKTKYIATETDLLPESRYVILFDITARDSELSLVLSVPRTSRFHQEVLEKRIDEYQLADRVEVIYKPLPKEVLENAVCYVSCNYNKTKIANALVRANDCGAPIIVAEDSLAECEMVDRKHQIEPNADTYIKAIKDIKKAKPQSINFKPLDELASGMVRL